MLDGIDEILEVFVVVFEGAGKLMKSLTARVVCGGLLFVIGLFLLCVLV